MAKPKVYNSPPVLLPHSGKNQMIKKDRTYKIAVNHGQNISLRIIRKYSPLPNERPGIVHENIDCTQPFVHLPNKRSNVIPAGNISLYGNTAYAHRLDFGLKGIGFRFTMYIIQCDVTSLLRQRQCGSFAKSLGTPGNQGDFSHQSPSPPINNFYSSIKDLKDSHKQHSIKSKPSNKQST
ncbi:hypothetical protein D1872_228430 [compost metagenome]